ncbi:MAG: glutamate formimidoyltransferase [Acidobacteriota bacterium]
MPLIECVPNVSEGRRPEVIRACAEAIAATGAALLDQTSDADHNRSVFTFAGQEAAVRAAVHALVDVALRSIDMRTHTGVHPRMGAVDVVPFVPLGETSINECVRIAREVGAELAARHDLPIFLYEAAASAPHRLALEQVRRGGFEGLTAKLQQPAWIPDFGPTIPHPSAGATIVGARPVLIAFNVNLATDRLDVARAVAAAVRQSSGGLPFVKALGLPLAERGIVQVSMNLTNFRETSIAQAFASVRDAAARYGVAVLESEVIGLVPAEALAAAGAASIQLPNFRADRLLEVQLLQQSGVR